MAYYVASDAGYFDSEDLGDLVQVALNFANTTCVAGIRDSNGNNIFTAWRNMAGVLWRSWPNHPGEDAIINEAWAEWSETHPADVNRRGY